MVDVICIEVEFEVVLSEMREEPQERGQRREKEAGVWDCGSLGTKK